MIAIILNLLFTAFVYMIFPFVKFYKKKRKYENKEIKKILIWNSVIIAMIFVFLSVIIYPDSYEINFAPAVFYYFLNSIIWETKEKIVKKEKNNKNIATKNLDGNNISIKQKHDKNIKIEKNYITILTILALLNIIFISTTLFFMEKDKKTKECYKIDYSLLKRECKEKIVAEVDINGNIKEKSECNLTIKELEKLYNKQITKCK